MFSKTISTNPAIMVDEIQRLKEGSKQFDALRSLSVKNLNSLPYYRASGYETNGIIYTYDDTGIVTANGTATANATFACHSRSSTTNGLIVPNGTYRLSGGISDKLYIFANYTKDGAGKTGGNDYGNGAVFHVDGSDNAPEGYTLLAIVCDVVSGETVENLAFKPMLELISLDDPKAFAAYSKTNNQLTSDINKLLCTKTTAGSYYLTATVNSEGAITYSWEVIE